MFAVRHLYAGKHERGTTVLHVRGGRREGEKNKQGVRE